MQTFCEEFKLQLWCEYPKNILFLGQLQFLKLSSNNEFYCEVLKQFFIFFQVIVLFVLKQLAYQIAWSGKKEM